MSNKLLQDIVLDLSKKVDDGFTKIDEKFNEINENIHFLEIRLKDQQSAIIDQSEVDSEVTSKVEKLDTRLSLLESRPVRWLKTGVSFIVATIGVLSTLLGLIWSLRSFF